MSSLGEKLGSGFSQFWIYGDEAIPKVRDDAFPFLLINGGVAILSGSSSGAALIKDVVTRRTIQSLKHDGNPCLVTGRLRTLNLIRRLHSSSIENSTSLSSPNGWLGFSLNSPTIGLSRWGTIPHHRNRQPRSGRYNQDLESRQHFKGRWKGAFFIKNGIVAHF